MALDEEKVDPGGMLENVDPGGMLEHAAEQRPVLVLVTCPMSRYYCLSQQMEIGKG